MNDEEEFSDCLERIGFDETARDFVENAGLSTVDELLELGPRQLTALFPHAARYKPKVADGEEQVNVPYTSVLKLQALRAWAEYRSRRGQLPSPLDFDDEVIATWLRRVRDIEDWNDEKQEAKAPSALSDTSKWPAFKAGFLSYLHDTRSIYNGVILDYVIREERGVTDELLEAVYTSLDNDMRATMELEGPEYVADNERVWKMLKPLVVDGPVWTHVRAWDKTYLGRDAWLSLVSQMEGNSAVASRRNAAYATLRTLRYTGQQKFPFEEFVRRHKEAHVILMDEGEPVPKTKKVTNLLAGVQDPRLPSAITTLMGTGRSWKASRKVSSI